MQKQTWLFFCLVGFLGCKEGVCGDGEIRDDIADPNDPAFEECDAPDDPACSSVCLLLDEVEPNNNNVQANGPFTLDASIAAASQAEDDFDTFRVELSTFADIQTQLLDRAGECLNAPSVSILTQAGVGSGSNGCTHEGTRLPPGTYFIFVAPTGEPFYRLNISITAACGDGVVEQTEACDDGNVNDGDGCESSCTLCGDNIVSISQDPNTVLEECDDGNIIDGDGCDSLCQSE